MEVKLEELRRHGLTKAANDDDKVILKGYNLKNKINCTTLRYLQTQFTNLYTCYIYTYPDPEQPP